MLSLVTHNFGWKLFALAASFGIWMSVASQPDLATIVSIPVEYSNFPRDLEISSAIVESVSVEASGPAIQTRSLPESKIAAVLDFSSVTAPGERTFTLTTNEIRLPRGTQMVRAIPAQLRFSFERRATRAVPVEVAWSGVLPAGISLGKVEVMPPELEITGPESHVRAARRLVSDPFDLSRVTGSAEQTLAVYAAESQVRFTGAPRVTVKVQINALAQPR
jgi:hypothetical protein